MATPAKPPVSWDLWKDGNDNYGASPVKLWLDYPADEEEPLPSVVDRRESEAYVVTEDKLTGTPHLDQLNRRLAKDYNTIALNRRDIIRRLYRIGKTECKGLSKAMANDVSRVRRASLQVKNSYRDLKRQGGQPVPYPDIFDQPIRAPF